jgi:DNA-directed RNA polymerase subunit beta'
VAEIQDFEEFRIGIVSPERIRAWSSGEVKKPETINYRTLKPERDGLFCEKIFGPTKDWECYCGKYKKVRFKGIICEKCGVEITRARVRRERMGHIELAAPVAHIWYFKGIPSKMGYLLDMSPKELEKVLYFASHCIVRIDTQKRQDDMEKLKDALAKDIDDINRLADEEKIVIGAAAEEKITAAEEGLKPEEGEKKAISAAKAANKPLKKEIADLEKQLDKALKELDDKAERRTQDLTGVFEFFKTMKAGQLAEFEDVFNRMWKRRNVSNEQLYWDLEDRYGSYFEGGIGAEAVRELLRDIDLEAEASGLKALIKGDGDKEAAKGQKKQKAIKRLKVVGAFRASNNRPEDMILETVPVIPPDLRPMVPLDGGRYATSDLNDLYRRVINRNNRLKRLLDLGAPKIIVNNEKRMLQEAVDTLFDNGRRGRPITGAGNRPLKSLSDMLKGKQGRFRQNLLGKRVDYSGRSVIVVGPDLKFYQCGLPKQIALELFKPFVMKRLVDKGLAPNIKGVKKLVERAHPVVWDVLEEVIKDQVVLLNRAPTLHRLGIQAFEPVLVEGKAIQIHPLVCTAFNADFDGDQMAVHLPLSAEAQAEARLLMLSAHNVLSPANGKPIATPTQDMVLGCYYLTLMKDDRKGEGRIFGSPQEAVMAEEFGEVDLRAKVTVRVDGERITDTTVGRVIFNSVLPDAFPYINKLVGKNDVSAIVTECVENYPMGDIVGVLDGIKKLGFKYATRAGTTIALDDIKVPKDKAKMLDEPEKAVAKAEQQYRRGLMTSSERHQRVVNIWTEATEKVSKAMEEEFERDPDNSVYMMATSGARGNLKQVRQLAAMRGLVVNPKGEVIDRPIKSNFREGMTVLEYFLSTHGGRKGLADTALRTADAGYLTRRLVDVVQDTIVREEDCGTTEFVILPVVKDDGDPNEGLISRIVSIDIAPPKSKKVILAKGEPIRHTDLDILIEAGVTQAAVRSVVTCDTRHGVCQQCYGLSLATGRLVDIGEAVGIIAAQSIGEPGTQLTLRTFHTGGVAAGGDITQGLPRVIELFEARKPKGQALLSDIDGKVSITTDKEDDVLVLTITTPAKKGVLKVEKAYKIPSSARVRVSDGDTVEAGDKLTFGSVFPADLVHIKGPRVTQQYLVDGVQEVYKSQGVDIHDKHIELITRQMLTKVFVTKATDTDFLPGQYVNHYEFEAENERVIAAGGIPASARQVILGITKSALETDSFLSAASFQETTRILTDSAVAGKSDPLLGLKENVIIGKLIPAGTGMKRYRTVGITPAESADSELDVAAADESALQAQAILAVEESEAMVTPEEAEPATETEEPVAVLSSKKKSKAKQEPDES